MGPASVPDAAASTEPSLSLSSGSGGITTQSVGPGPQVMLFSYNRPKGGSDQGGQYVVGSLRYEVQQSVTLGSWMPADVQEVDAVPLENGWERVTVRVPTSGDRTFLRVKVSD
jgi:hypothetical protein